MVYSFSNEDIYMDGFSPELYCFDIDNFNGFVIPFYTYDDGEMSSDPGDEEPEEGTDEDLVSDNQVEYPDDVPGADDTPDEQQEETGSDTLSENTVSDNSVSENEADDVSDNQVHHDTDYEGSWQGEVIVNVDSGLDEWMPQVTDLLVVIGGCVVFLVVVVLLKYIYKFFRIFF